MARERMVTRTVEEAEVSVMTVNTETEEVFTRVHHVSATIGEENVLKYIQKHFDTDKEKSVMIQKYETTEILYGMSEQTFIALAKVLPPRNSATTED